MERGNGQISKPSTGRLNGIKLLFNKLGKKISGLFQPEEVEVTFKVEGKNTRYTYTKVDHKQVA